MERNRLTWMAAVLGTVAATGMTGCNRNIEQNMGAASVSIKALSIADIAKVTVSVQGASMPAPLVVPLVQKGQQFSALVSNLPVGTNYSFTASAKDATSKEIYHGSVSNQTIIKNQVANIVINMNQVDPGDPLVNHAPVVDSLSATSLLVGQGDPSTIKATAHDPDAGQTALMGWAWTSTCGMLSNIVTTPGNDTTPGASKVLFTAPATDGTCTVNLTITDANGALKNVASLTIQINGQTSTGNAKITAIPNTYPVISGLNATPVPLLKGVATTLTVTASDPDGDTLNYNWSSPCSGVFSANTSATTTFTLDMASTATSCDFIAIVDDGLFLNGAVKGIITNHLTLPVSGPTVVGNDQVFGYDFQSQDTISSGDVVKMAIVANQGCVGGTLGLIWASSDGQTLGSTTPAAIGLDASLFHASAATYSAPIGAENGPQITVTVTSTCSISSATASHQFLLAPANSFCAGKANGTDCTSALSGSNKCVLAAACTNNVCEATNQVPCSASTNVCQTNACDPADGLCKLSNKLDNTPCNDGNACTGDGNTDLCTAGVCSGAPRVCPGDGNACHVATCDITAGCGIGNAPNGTTCNDQNGCTGANNGTVDSCTAGTCGGETVICPIATEVCVSLTDSTHNCQGVTPPACMAASYAQRLVPPLSGMNINPAGTPWVVGQIYNPFDFGSGTVQSTGSADIYMAKLNPDTGLATETFIFGDKGKKDQSATGVAVASQGNVGMIGSFTGEVDFTVNTSDAPVDDNGDPIGKVGIDFLTNASQIAFYGVFNGASTGTYVTPKKVHMVDVGTGALLSISSNPNQDAFAICGKTSTLVGNYANGGGNKGLILPTGTATAGGGMDIIVAKINASTGAVIWGKQFGGSNDQICDSVTIDNNGDVIIAGNYAGTLEFSATVKLDPVTTTGVGLLYVARLASADGTPMAAKTWGTSGRNNAYGLTVDANNDIIVGGSLNGNIDFGGGVSIVNAGLTDAFVLKLTSALTPVWAKSYGDDIAAPVQYDQVVKTIGTSSDGSVYIAGSFKGSLGELGLAASSNTALDAFTARLNGATGSPTGCNKKYGDADGAQAVSLISVARAATGSMQNSVMVGGAFSGDIEFNTTLSTGSPGIAASFIARMAP